jgi:hypothetical protein
LDVDHKSVELLASTMVGAGEEMGRWWDLNPHLSKDEVTDRFKTIVQGAVLAVAREASVRSPAGATTRATR